MEVPDIVLKPGFTAGLLSQEVIFSPGAQHFGAISPSFEVGPRLENELTTLFILDAPTLNTNWLLAGYPVVLQLGPEFPLAKATNIPNSLKCKMYVS